MVSGHSKRCSAIERCCHDNHLRVFAGVWAQPPPPRETHRAVLVVPLARQARYEEGCAEQDHADTPARTGFVAALWHLTYHWPPIAQIARLQFGCGCASRTQPLLYRSARWPVMACLKPAALARGRGRRRAAAWRQFSSSPAVWLLAAAQTPSGARLWMTPIRLPLRGAWRSKPQRAQHVD